MSDDGASRASRSRSAPYIQREVRCGYCARGASKRSDDQLCHHADLYRTHEGLDPDVSAQFDSDPANTRHLKRFATIFKALAPYRKRAIAEAAARGTPVVRHPFLHFPGDPNVHGLRYQFLLGANMMVAPVLDKGASSVEVYFPDGAEWIDMWLGEDVGAPGTWQRIPAPLGKPAVFLRKGTASAGEIRHDLKLAGIL